MFAEDKNTEFKREYIEDIKKTVIAFANCDGGTLYIGINNDGSVCGISDADSTMLRVTNSVREAIRPDITMFTDFRREIMEGTASLSQKEAKEVMARTYFYPPIKQGYVSSICGKACDRACYIHLEEKGVLIRQFTTHFRKRPEWELDILEPAKYEKE